MMGLLLLVLSLTSLCSETKLDQAIERLLRDSLKIQYEKESKIRLKDAFTDKFIEDIDECFYKRDKAPFDVMNVIELKQYALYNIRIEDKAGEYIQEVKVIKIGNEFRIDRILYDV